MGLLEKVRRFKPSPTQLIVLSFALVICAGTLLLMLPVSLAPGQHPDLMTALFTATSCTCVTGLVVVETGMHFSLFGQLVILLLIQIGGLGFMTLTTLLLIAFGKKITLRDRMIIQESFNAEGLQGLLKLILRVCRMVLVMEFGGALVLSVRMVPRFGWGRGLYYSLFHSVSAFCNAGFDVLGQGDSIRSLNNDPVVMITLMLLVVLGGLGFPVIMDLMNQKKFSRLELHTKVVLLVTGVLLLGGFVLFFAFEVGNPATLGDTNMLWRDKLINALFQSVTVRTAGFASFAQGDMAAGSKLLSVALMFIGASPTSTGGGIKTTTFACVLLVIVAALRGKTSIHVFGRRLPLALVLRAMAIFMIALIVLAALVLGMTVLEPTEGNGMFATENIIYEAASALGTAGLTTGITPYLTIPSKLLLVLAMFMGRVGPLSLTLALSRRLNRSSKLRIEYPEDHIIVG